MMDKHTLAAMRRRELAQLGVLRKNAARLATTSTNPREQAHARRLLVRIESQIGQLGGKHDSDTSK